MNIFQEGNPQNIAQVLAGKDYRVALQQAILKKYPDATLVDINLNIPGPIKNNRYLIKLFDYGIKQLEEIWQNKGYDYKLVKALNNDAGCENFYVLRESSKVVKLSTILFEENNKIGRLFDADVLIKGKTALSRQELEYSSRRCYLCNRPAKECARSRRHSVEEMQRYISSLYAKYVNN
ncbi:citrate lyase holo-[acyl-carrier protein] synthase [Lactobacillus helveticus]|uniref:citrate lyase holo-[acyl-carrier protein] synthase n=1 Tax=Lactobacillus helveticus TaxID=1587 RepID=UPI0021821048|nr:citrate lyase holo-[acyl-carrier protein] synthase [Lactobacillus helveticus]MCT0192334.1 citrate lyase holo-[acyl-carrier protein] synthase [Lactobacillus helveticus]